MADQSIVMQCWALTLPDLASRLRATNIAHLDPPDEALLSGVLVKLFADRQVRATPRLVSYLTRRMERSFAAAETIVDLLDRTALATGRPVGLQLAASILDRDEEGSHETDTDPAA